MAGCTFDSAIQKRLSQLTVGSAEHIEYLLDITPYISDYYRVGEKANGQDDDDDPSIAVSRKLAKIVTTSHQNTKGVVYTKYMANIERDHTSIMKLNEMTEKKAKLRADACKYCGCDSYWMKGSFRVCMQCCCEIFEQDMSIAGLTFDQQIHDIQPVMSYRKQNHLKEWLAKIQARHFVNISDSIWDALKVELKKNRISHPQDITQKRIRGYLKKLKLSWCYDHTAYIVWKLSGIRPPQVSPKLECRITMMFEEIQAPFHHHRPKKRHNMLKYSYILYKMFELLGKDEFLENLPLLKNKHKLREHDVVWQKICADVGWQFIRSC